MNSKQSEQKNISVAILDDHQGALDGYSFRLASHKDITVVAAAQHWNELEQQLLEKAVDVLILDVSVPTSDNDKNPYPILHVLPTLQNTHPEMAILVISMHKQRTLVKAVMAAGAKGYILKDDREAIVQLAEIIKSVAAGGVYLSEQSYAVLTEKNPPWEDMQTLTARQLQALSLCASSPDISTEDLATMLNIAPSTLRNLLSSAYERLNVSSRAAAIAKAREMGLITPFSPEPEDAL
jgi:DNA-binding NarL/FixJ family response regulator